MDSSKPELIAIPDSISEIKFQETSLDIWESKYCLKTKQGEKVDESIDETYKRVARALVEVEQREQREHWYEHFLWALRHGVIPAGRIISNAGAQELSKKAIGFNRENRDGADAEAIEKMFTPEFRNRLDAIIPFAPLEHDVIRLVVDKFMMQLDAQLAERNVEIELTEAARDWLANRGYDRNYGARPLTRVVQEHIKKPLADQLLFGDLTGGGLALVDVEDDALMVTVKAPPQKALPGKRTALPAPESG